ncbi:DNA polymerase III subunit gamma/tau, partial [Phaeobacter sp. HF9A]|nr:DNA polymerase III subunit gamma/tau [Phaeobacter sp. HF9A]
GGGGAPASASAPPQDRPGGGPGNGHSMSAGSGYGQATAVAPRVDSALARYPSFEHVIELIRKHRDVKLLVEVEGGVRLVSYQPGRIEFTPAARAPKDLAARLGTALQNWTGSRWVVSIAPNGDAPTIAELRDEAENALREKASAHPMVQAVLSQFPKARITKIRTPEELEAEVQADALPEVEDEWDPFEE